MEHRDAIALAGARHDGSLDGFRAVRLDEHLRGCPECRATEKRIPRLGDGLRALPALEPPKDIAEAVRGAASRHATGSPGPAAAPAPAPMRGSAAARRKAAERRRQRLATTARIAAAVLSAGAVAAAAVLSGPAG